jgi:hypothetical protein
MRLRCGYPRKRLQKGLTQFCGFALLQLLPEMFGVDGFNLGSPVVAFIIKLFTSSRAIS